MLDTAHSKCGLKPYTLREIVCGVLRKRPDQNNWSEYPNVWGEVESHVYSCEWFRVYDITEAIRAHLAGSHTFRVADNAETVLFDTEINAALRELGIGWQLLDGMIQTRGDDNFEQIVSDAKERLLANQKTTAHNELTEAIKDISRRPEPDATGAVQHSMAALECVAKDVTGQSKATLGEILKKNNTLVPKPLDEAVHKLWGFASDKARHVREGETLDRHEAHLVVGLSAALTNYLIQKAEAPES